MERTKQQSMWRAYFSRNKLPTRFPEDIVRIIIKRSALQTVDGGPFKGKRLQKMKPSSFELIESFRFEDENEDEDEDEALGFLHKEICKLFRLQLGRDDEVDCNNIVPAKLKTKKFEDFLVAKTECFVLVLVFVLVLESKAL